MAGFWAQRLPHRSLVDAKLRHCPVRGCGPEACPLHGECVQDVIDASHWSCTLLEKLVRAGAQRTEHAAWYGHHLTALLEREVSGDQRPTAFAGLDDHRSSSQTRDDAVTS